MCNSIEDINISEIDLADKRYKISDSCDDMDALSRSISETGLIHPVLVRFTNGRYILVSGFRRVEASLRTGVDRIKIIRVTEIDDHHSMELHCIKISIADNAFQRELTTSEIIRSISLLCDYLDIDQISEQSVSIFKTHLNFKIIGDYCSIARLSADVYKLFQENKLAVKPAVKLTKMPPDQAGMFLSLFGKIRISSSKQLDILTLCHEISAREKIDLKTLLSSKDLIKILEQDNPDLGAKGDQIRTYLRLRRFPHILSTERKFNETIRKMSLKNDISITHPKDFEGISYGASFQFQSILEYMQKVEKLRLLSQNPLFKDLIS